MAIDRGGGSGFDPAMPSMIEMTGQEVEIPAGAPGQAPERTTPGYAVLPPGAKRGAVVLHELYGRQPEIDRVVERFGRQGYAAVAPDLFATGSRLSCIRQAIQATRSGRGPQIDQIQAARRWLCGTTGIAEKKVGLIGFCLGGGFALAAGRGWGAVSTNYGEVPSQEVMRGIGPVIGCYGGKDVIFRDTGEKLAARLRPLGSEVEVHRFDSVGHSFLTDGHHPLAETLSWPLFHIRYDPEVAEEAWSKIFAYFDRHL
jgi:carboxymethylenebutenolidase